MHQRHKPNVGQAQDALSSAKALLELLKDLLYDEKDWLLEGTAFINDREKAKRYFVKSNAVKPNPDAYYYLGNIECEAQNFLTAIKHFEEALKYAKKPFIYYSLGRCYEYQGLYEDAIKQYNNSINLKCPLRDPYNNPYYRKLLILTEQNFDFIPNDIINLLNVIIKIFPQNTKFLILRAKYALKLDQKTIALDDLESAVNIDENLRKDIANNADFDILKDEEQFKRRYVK